jgi:hypothetical protein
MRKITYCLFILFYSIGCSGFAQSITASAKLDTNAMLIGDQVKLNLSFSYPSNTMVSWPKIGDTILQTIQVIRRSKIDSSLSVDKKTLTLHQNFLITCFDSGFYTIPPIRFFYRELPDTNIRFVQTETLLLSVHTLAVDTTKVIKPIKGPLSILFYFKKRKKAEPVFKIRSEIKLLPHELALSELEKLRIKKLWQGGRTKEYHSELTDILRNYLENRFSIMALEMTSQDIIDSIRAQNTMHNESIGKLNHILAVADLVKFAKMQPLPAENEWSMENAVAFVHETAVVKEQTVIND